MINEEIDTTVVMRLMSEAMPLRTIQQTARGSETYLMLTSRTYNSMDAQEFSSILLLPSSTKDSVRIQNAGRLFLPPGITDEAPGRGNCPAFAGKMPAQQITPLPKEYVLNWHALQRYGISATGLPEEYTVMYIPFSSATVPCSFRVSCWPHSLSSPSLLFLYIAYAMNGDGNGRLCVRSGMSTRLLNLLSKEA